MRSRARILLLAVAALAVFGAVVAIQLGRARSTAVAPGPGSAADGRTEPPSAAGLAAAGDAVERGGAGAAAIRGNPAPGAGPAHSIRLEFGALDAAALERATFVLRVLGSDGIERTVASAVSLKVIGSVFLSGTDFRAWLSPEAARTDVRIEGLPPGAASGLAIVIGATGGVLGIGGPVPIGVGSEHAVLDVVSVDRLGSVVADVRRGGAAFGPAALVVRAGGLTVGALRQVRGRATPVPAPTGTPLEVRLVEAPGHEDLGLPRAQELTLSPRETREVPFDLDDGVPFAIRAIGPDGAPLPFRALVWTHRTGRGPRPAPGLLLTTGIALEHTGRGPDGEVSVLVIPSRTGAPTWARVALAGRSAVAIDVRVALDGGVLDLHLVDDDGAPRADWQVALVRTDAVTLDAFATWSGSLDARGHVVTPPLPAGAYLLEVGGRYVRPVTIPISGLTLSLAVPPLPNPSVPGPVLDVTVSDPDGGPRSLASAYVRPEGDGWGQRLTPRRDEPGRCEAVVLEAGRFRVVAPFTWDAGPGHGAVDVPVTLLGEGVLRVDVRVPPPP